MAQIVQKSLALVTTAWAPGVQATVDLHDAPTAGAGSEVHAMFVENTGVVDVVFYLGCDIGVVYDVIMPGVVPAGQAIEVVLPMHLLAPGQRLKARASVASTLTMYATVVER